MISGRYTYPWATVARSLDRNGSQRPDGGPWTGPALARAVRRLARDGFVDEAVLERTPRRRDSDNLAPLVVMAVKTLEHPTLTKVARHFEGLHCRTPRGETRWSVSSVQNLLGQAVAQRLLEDRLRPTPNAPRRRGRPLKSLKPHQQVHSPGDCAGGGLRVCGRTSFPRYRSCR
ncbi:hypothetical protein [Azospirillum sp. SYSU D00513]|uniref:hypothetical protein n=1 Tax=Azospirillum sp. SYSU D00513 TaxID=2812561 RepID=UPI001A960A5D|nr:hypothetical protein [Azospirillum sp. SYSU D00513]